jgi:hypothetical protein
MQRDTDFSGVRGGGLGKLPEAERKEWQMLWDHAEALRKRAVKEAANAVAQPNEEAAVMQPELVPPPKVVGGRSDR